MYPYFQSPYGLGMAQNEGAYPNMLGLYGMHGFQPRQGGALPPQAMPSPLTGGGLPPQQMGGPQTGGGLPPMQAPMIRTGGAMQRMPMAQNRLAGGFDFGYRPGQMVR